MQATKLPYSTIPILSKRDISYIEEVPSLKAFYKYPVSLSSFEQAIADKSKESIDRQLLVEVLQEQYSKVEASDKVESNISKLLDKNCFTIVTAHQPCLFTGPLYYVYKIISTIKLANQLTETHPGYNFVPVFINSGEDHDFAEVNHANIFGKRLEWESGETGPVGEMGTSSLAETLENLGTILGNSPSAVEFHQLLKGIFTKHKKYEDAAFELVHELFKQYGLVVLNTSSPALKKSFAPIIKEEILHQPSIEIVKRTITELEVLGFPSQATPREINFFYLGPNFRERIVKEGEVFKVLNTTISFSEKKMEEEIEQSPERFSPNVVMRPIYQEKILPNLAYIGGGGELAYWLERKAQFEHFGINFPVLVRRDSALWIDAVSNKKMVKLGLKVDDLWMDGNELVRSYLQRNSENQLGLDSEKASVRSVFDQISQKIKEIDASLVNTVWAEHAKVEKSIELLEAKMMKAEKQKQEVSINQILGLREKLLPGGGLQERHDNFIPLYLKHGANLFETLLESFDPLEKKFTIIIED